MKQILEDNKGLLVEADFNLVDQEEKKTEDQIS
jgi:hypothetical protein